VQLIAGVSVSAKGRWRGELYGLAVYGDTLSAAQVRQNLDNWQTESFDQIERTQNPYLFYPFNERRGEIIHNLSAGRGHWLIPSRFSVIRKTFLGSVNGDIPLSRPLVKDVLINIAGFFLLGFFMALFLGRKLKSAILIVISVFFICSLLSLGIEYAQVWLAQRDSALLDFVINSAGGLLGGVGFVVVLRVKGKG
jgi:hypothetical protein